MEEESRNSVHDQEKQNKQFMEMLTKFGEEVRKVEDLEKKVTQRQTKLLPESISTTAVLERPDENLIQPRDVLVQHLPLVYTVEVHLSPRKLMKAPSLPPFLGADPVLKEEGSWEQ